LGWDTDQFPTNIYLTTEVMLTLLKYGGIAPGGVNFDAKVRRESIDPVDLFHAHIGGMDAFARGLNDDLHGTMITAKEAEISLKLVGSIRTKLLDAFHELWRISV
jgi:xylose isomerase